VLAEFEDSRRQLEAISRLQQVYGMDDDTHALHEAIVSEQASDEGS
jgi:hypothetical protein